MLAALALPSSAGREAVSDDTVFPGGNFEHGTILQLAFCSHLNAPALSMKAVMAPSMRAHRSKLLLDGNRAKPMHEVTDRRQVMRALGAAVEPAFFELERFPFLPADRLDVLPPPALPSCAGREAGSDDKVFPGWNTV